MKIVAVVPTFNRRFPLERSLKALLNQSFPLSAVIVVDNASTDGTMDYLQVEAGRESAVEIIPLGLKENRGSAGGFKAGIEEGMRRGFDLFYLMDDDAVPEETALEELLKSPFFLSGEKTVVGSMMYDSASGEVTWVLTARSESGRYLLNDLSGSEVGVEVEGLTYTGMLLSREMVETSGYPLESLFAWWDDAEYCFRLKKAGYSSYVVPSSKIFHPRKPTEKRSLFGRWQVLYHPGVEPWRFYYYIRNGIYVFNRHYTGILWFKSVAGLFLQSFFITISHKHKWKMIRSTFVGAFDGFIGRLGTRVRRD